MSSSWADHSGGVEEFKAEPQPVAIEMQPLSLVTVAPPASPPAPPAVRVDPATFVISDDELAKQRKLLDFCRGLYHFTTTRVKQQYFELFRRGLFYTPLYAPLEEHGLNDYAFSYAQILTKNVKRLEPEYTDYFYQYLNSLGLRESVKPYKCVLTLCAEDDRNQFDSLWMISQLNALTKHVDSGGYFPFEGIFVDWGSIKNLTEDRKKELQEALNNVIKAFDGTSFFIEVQTNTAGQALVKSSIDSLYGYGVASKPTTEIYNGLLDYSGSVSFEMDPRVREQLNQRPFMSINQRRKQRKDALYRPDEEKLNEKIKRASKLALLRHRETGQREELVVEYADEHAVEATVVQEVSVQIEIQDRQANPTPEGEVLRSFDQIKSWKVTNPEEYRKYNQHPTYQHMSLQWSKIKMRKGGDEYKAKQDLYESLILNFKSYGVGVRVTHITQAALEYYAGPGRAHLLSGCALTHLPVGFYIKPIDGREDEFSLHYDPLDQSVDNASPLCARPVSCGYQERRFNVKKAAYGVRGRSEKRSFVGSILEVLQPFPILMGALRQIKNKNGLENIGRAIKERGIERVVETLRQIESTLVSVSDEQWTLSQRSGTMNRSVSSTSDGRDLGMSLSPRDNFIEYFLVSKGADFVRNFMSLEGISSLAFFENCCDSAQKDTFIQKLSKAHLQLYPHDSFVNMMKAYAFFVIKGEEFAKLHMRTPYYSSLNGVLSKYYAQWAAANFSQAQLVSLKNFQRQTEKEFPFFPIGYLYPVLKDQYKVTDPRQKLCMSEQESNVEFYRAIFDGANIGFEVTFEQLVKICQFDYAGVLDRDENGEEESKGGESGCVGPGSAFRDKLRILSFCKTSFFRYIGQQDTMDFTFEIFDELIDKLITSDTYRTEDDRLNALRRGLVVETIRFLPLLALLYSGKAGSTDHSQQVGAKKGNLLNDLVKEVKKLVSKYDSNVLNKVYSWLLQMPGTKVPLESVNGMLKMIGLVSQPAEIPVLDGLFQRQKISGLGLTALKKIGRNKSIRDDSRFMSVLVSFESELSKDSSSLKEHTEQILHALSVLNYTDIDSFDSDLRLFFEAIVGIKKHDILVAILEGIALLVPGESGEPLTFAQAAALINRAKNEDTAFAAKKIIVNERPEGIGFDLGVGGYFKLKWLDRAKSANSAVEKKFDYSKVFALSFDGSIEPVLPDLESWGGENLSKGTNTLEPVQKLIKIIASYPFALLQDKLGFDSSKQTLCEEINLDELVFNTGKPETLVSAFIRSHTQSHNALTLLNWVEEKSNRAIFDQFLEIDSVTFTQLIKAEGAVLFMEQARSYLTDSYWQERILNPVLTANIQSLSYYACIASILNCKKFALDEHVQLIDFAINNQSKMPVIQELISAIDERKDLSLKHFFRLLSADNVKDFKAIYTDPLLHPVLACLDVLEDTKSLHILVEGYLKIEGDDDKSTYVEVLKHYLEDAKIIRLLSSNIEAIKNLHDIADRNGKFPSFEWVRSWLSCTSQDGKDLLFSNIETQPFGPRDFDAQFKNDDFLKDRILKMYPDSPVDQLKLYDAVGYVNALGKDHALYYTAKLGESFDKPVCELTNEALKSASGLIRNELAKNSSRYTPDQLLALQLEFLAIAREAFYRGDNPKSGSKPRLAYQTQLLSVIHNLLFNGNMNYGINTGEGKSVTTALMSACEWVNGKTVDLTTSSVSLAKRDFRNTQSFYDRLGIPVGLIYKNSAMEAYQKEGVNIASAPHLAIWQIRAGLEGRQLPEARTLVSDEFDMLALDSNSSFNFSRPNVNPDRPLENPFAWIYEHIVGYVNKVCENPDRYKRQTVGEDIDDLKAYLLGSTLTSDKKDIINGGLITRSMLSEWLDAGFKAATLIENDDYVVRDEQGRRQVFLKRLEIDREGRYSYGIHQMLQAKYGADITPESLNIGSLSPQAFLQQYSEGENRLIGLTGTPGNEAELAELQQDYGLHTVKVPYHKPHKSSRYSPKVVQSEQYADDDHIKAIFEVIRDRHGCELEQQIVVFLDNAAAVEKLHAKLMADPWYPGHCQKYTGSEPGVKVPDVIAKAALKSMVTVTTDVLGRGADIKVNSEKGVFVIQTSPEDSERTMRQRTGRQARNGQNGCYREVYSAGSLGLSPGTSQAVVDARVKEIHQKNEAQRSLMRYESKLTGFYKKQCMREFLKMFHVKMLASQERGNRAETDNLRKSLYKKCSIFLRNFSEYWNQNSADYKATLARGRKVTKDQVKTQVLAFAENLPDLFQSAFGETITLQQYEDPRKLGSLKRKQWQRSTQKMKYLFNLSALGHFRLLNRCGVNLSLDEVFKSVMQTVGVKVDKVNGSLVLNHETLKAQLENKKSLMQITYLLCEHAKQYSAAVTGFSTYLKKQVRLVSDPIKRSNILKSLAMLRQHGCLSLDVSKSAETSAIFGDIQRIMSTYKPGWSTAQNRKVELGKLKHYLALFLSGSGSGSTQDLLSKLEGSLRSVMRADMRHNLESRLKRNIKQSTFISICLQARERVMLDVIAQGQQFENYKMGVLVSWTEDFVAHINMTAKFSTDPKYHNIQNLLGMLAQLNGRGLVKRHRANLKAIIKFMRTHQSQISKDYSNLATVYGVMLSVFEQEEIKMKFSREMRKKDAHYSMTFRDVHVGAGAGAGAGAGVGVGAGAA